MMVRQKLLPSETESHDIAPLRVKYITAAVGLITGILTVVIPIMDLPVLNARNVVTNTFWPSHVSAISSGYSATKTGWLNLGDGPARVIVVCILYESRLAEKCNILL